MRIVTTGNLPKMNFKTIFVGCNPEARAIKITTADGKGQMQLIFRDKMEADKMVENLLTVEEIRKEGKYDE